VPPNVSQPRITQLNNPNTSLYEDYPKASPESYQMVISPATYVQFMMDYGRDVKAADTYVPLSLNNQTDCPLHAETVTTKDGTQSITLNFPPSSQPMHGTRRALVAALLELKKRNPEGVSDSQRDWVSVIRYDKVNSVVVLQTLSAQYTGAMQACSELQACNDELFTTATGPALKAAHQQLTNNGRPGSDKLVILLTDGVPNLYTPGSEAQITTFMASNPRPEWANYDPQAYWYLEPLMHALKMQLDNITFYPVGVGLGGNSGFLNDLASLADNEAEGGGGYYVDGMPNQYEEKLKEILNSLLRPKIQLVQ